MEISSLAIMTYDDICRKIDQLMYDKFQVIDNYLDRNYKKAAKILIEYFDKIGKKEAKKYFYFTFPIREKIVYNVIYNEKTRKNIAEI